MRADDFNFYDNLYDNAVNKVIIETKEAYENMNLRNVWKNARKMLQLKDEYLSRVVTFHKDLFIRFITVHIIMVWPIIPHFSEALLNLHKKYTH